MNFILFCGTMTKIIKVYYDFGDCGYIHDKDIINLAFNL